MQDRSPPARRNPLATHGRTIHSGHNRTYAPQQITALFDHLAGSSKQRRRHREQKPRAISPGLQILARSIRLGVYRLEETIVHTNQDIALGRFGADGTAGRTESGSWGDDSPRLRAKVHVITFEKRRPVRCEHPLNAATNRPAASGVGGLATKRSTTRNDGYACSCMSPGAAALKVEQPVGLHCIANAGRQGVEPLISRSRPWRQDHRMQWLRTSRFYCCWSNRTVRGRRSQIRRQIRNRSRPARHRQSRNRLRRLPRQ